MINMFRAKSAVNVRVFAPGPYVMNPYDVKDFSIKLFRYFMVWELLRQVLLRVARWLIPAPKDDKEKDVRRFFPKQITGAVHAAIVAVHAAIILRWMVALAPEDQYYVRAGGHGLTTSQRDFVEHTWWLFMGYLVQDTTHMVIQYPNLGKMDMMIHHVVFCVAAVLAGSTQTMTLPFSWLLLGEASTPILTVRWCIQSASMTMKSEKVITVAKALGYKGAAVSSVHNAGKALEFLNGVCLIITFFLVRIVVYSIGYPHMIWAWRTGILSPVPDAVCSAVSGLVGIGALLNMHWFSIMIGKAMKGPPKLEKSAGAKS